MTDASVIVGLSAVIVACDGATPLVLATRNTDASGLTALPFGPFDPIEHRTFELGLRKWVSEQTGFDLGYVEQLYTFGDKGRDLPQARQMEAAPNARVISVGYLALAPERTTLDDYDAIWCDWYRFFPWEDHRQGRPPMIDETIAPALTQWSDAAESKALAATRLDRSRLAFGLEGRAWIEERVLERYELLYEADLVSERRHAQSDSPSSANKTFGAPMVSDHRRILATALGRLRGKLKYRPVVFELLSETFTLSGLQQVVEALLGLSLHKQNFRRALDKTGLVEGTGQFETATGGRPAELFRFRREILREKVTLGVQAPAVRS